MSKGIERCDWIMVSHCKINAKTFIQNKRSNEAKTFILKARNHFAVTAFNTIHIIVGTPSYLF